MSVYFRVSREPIACAIQQHAMSTGMSNLWSVRARDHHHIKSTLSLYLSFGCMFAAGMLLTMGQ